MNRTLIKYTGYFILAIFLLLIATFRPLNKDSFETKDFYRETLNSLHSLDENLYKSKDIEIGWSEINFTPQKKSKLVGYGPRQKYDYVEDSTFASCFFIHTEKGDFLVLNFDLLVIHHTLTKAIEDRINSNPSLKISGIYYTCSHSHSSYGGWAKGILAKFSLGGFDPDILEFMVQRTEKMVLKASKAVSKCKVAYLNHSIKSLVSHRVNEEAPVDDLLRLILFKNERGEKAGLVTCAAHPTFNRKSTKTLRAEYPTYAKQLLKNHFNLQQVSFLAGAVGSTTHRSRNNVKMNAKQYGHSIVKSVIETTKNLNYKPISTFNFNKLQIKMPQSQFKISNKIVLRPYIFDFIYGKPDAQIGCITFNKTSLFGVSGEISGETMSDIERHLNDASSRIIPTSFNGDYIGYLTHQSHYYSKEHTETRDLNFFGPHNTEYFIEISTQFLNKINQSGE